jgi:hypothetical protein
MANINQLRNVTAPNLPIASSQYSQQYTDEYSNVLRLYFNQLSNFTSTVSSVNSGLALSHIGASDTTDQYATADNTPTIVKWNTLDSGLGFTLNSDNSATAQYSGVYKIDYSLQFANTDNTPPHDVDVWLKINNIDVPGSTSKFTIPARKSAGIPSYILAVSFVVFKLNAGDIVKLYWATDKAFIVSPATNGVYMEYKPAQTVPFEHPSIPSAIGAISFMSSLY